MGLVKGQRPPPPPNKFDGKRKRGPAKATEIMRNMVTDAVADLGFDGKGKDGARGWLRRQAIDHPCEYLRLIGKMMPFTLSMEMRLQIDALLHRSTERDYETVADARRALEDDGITIDHFLPHADVLDLQANEEEDENEPA